MYLPAITKSIAKLLVDFEMKELPNYPNLYGVYEQSQVIYEITEGEDDGLSFTEDIINLTLKVSLACEQRTNKNDDFVSVEYDLESLISYLIQKLRKAMIPGCKLIQFRNFQKFAPDSGKYRALLTFNIPAYITKLPGESEDNGTIERIEHRYL